LESRGACPLQPRRESKGEDAPFAFLATYTTQLSAEAKAQHLPLDKALQEYAGARNRQRLLSFLMPVQRASEHCPWLKAMVDGGEIFHPLRWSPMAPASLLANWAAEKFPRAASDQPITT
jgi:non-specific serine/threonine protein kinase